MDPVCQVGVRREWKNDKSDGCGESYNTLRHVKLHLLCGAEKNGSGRASAWVPMEGRFFSISDSY